ncbi:MAG: carboxylesterase family protein [Syntrophales bacterium]
MKSYRIVQKSIIMFLILSLLTACGGGGGSSDTTPNPSPSTYSISGTVTSSGSWLQGVTMALSGASSATATTDANGNYTFAGLANSGYTLTPSQTGYTFTPTNIAVTINGAAVTGQNFTRASAASVRYIDTLFPSVDITANVVFANAPQLNSLYLDETNTMNINLTMDIYTPRGDTQIARPAIIFVHGGAFLLGNKNHDDMMAFCTEFARKGYVTASINYRLGMNVASAMSATRAVYRGLQDGRSAVRFLRKNAAQYGIDANKVFMAGSSAGGFIALQSVYMNEAAEKPVEAGVYTYSLGLLSITAPDLGSYDSGTNTDMKGTPDAIMSLWGAVKHTDLITPADTTPVFLVHGKVDAIVPFGVSSPFSVPIFPATYGSSNIYDKLTQLGSVNKLSYFVDGQGHEFYGVLNGAWTNGIGGNEHWNIILEKVVDFFYGQL